MCEVVYSSNIDISLGKGPSVNELEFVDALVKCNDVSSKIIIPKPRYGLRKGLADKVEYATSFPISGRNIFHWLLWETVFLFKMLKLRKSDAKFIFRVSLFPIGLLICCRLISGRYHLKTVGDGSFRYLSKLPLGGILIMLNQAIFRSLTKHAFSIDMVTEKHRSNFASIFKCSDKCYVVDNKVNIDVFRPVHDKETLKKKHGLSEFDCLVGYVGNDPIRRGAVELVQAVQKLRADYQLNAGAVIVGGMVEADVRELEKYVIDNSSVRLLGQLPYTVVPEVMACLDIGVSFLPEWHRGASEQKVRQYLACGVVPVVTPGGSEFVAKVGVGYVAENEDIACVAKVIYEAFLNVDTKRKACREYAEIHLSHQRLATERLEILCGSRS